MTAPHGPATLHSELVQTRFFEFEQPDNPLQLRCGGSLGKFTLAYETYGRLNGDRSNAILLFHAMTGSQHASGWNTQVLETDTRWTEELHEGWWGGFIGPGKALDTRKFFVICANYLGGCYGSTGPASINPATGRRWASSFPAIRMGDIVDSQIKLLDHLGIDRLHAVIGSSIGGFLCQHLATRYPERVRNIILIGTGIETTISQRIMNFEQITAIESDPNFLGGDYHESSRPDIGLALARRIAHKTFIAPDALRERARDEVVSSRPPFGWYEMKNPVESYMLHQGEKFIRRFDANSYLRILDAWQWFDLLEGSSAKNVAELFSRCREQHFLVFSIDSDVAFHPKEQERLVRLLEKARASATWITVHSDKGHDSFLLEPSLFGPHLTYALAQ
ncbi:MAG: homoserine O-acetyltransferase [Methylacidiphilales bacterium]|nr:homoserine O-acetyltransferase [Candidatus Methylacidiphilales bacterium]